MSNNPNHPDIATAMSIVSNLPNVTVAWSMHLADGRVLEYRADAGMEAGSAFKAIVAAACCRLQDSGHIAWTDKLTIRPEDRVEASEVLERLPDGSDISLDEAIHAMLTYSDNTATDMILDHIGRVRVLDVVKELELTNLHIPLSVKHLYSQPEDRHLAGFTTSMHDLRRFYDAVFDTTLLGTGPAQAKMLEFLRGEDAQQGTDWRNGVTCHRKSGSIESPFLVAQGIGGAFVRDGRFATFAVAANWRSDQPYPSGKRFEAFSRGFGGALKLVTETLKDGYQTEGSEK